MNTNYFDRRQFTPHIQEAINPKLGICIVLPSYNEPELEASLRALASCNKPSCAAEIIVVVNYPEHSSEEIKANALQCLETVKSMDRQLNDSDFRFFPIAAFDMPKKHAGVGLARKTGMDEAAWRLLHSQSEYKIIGCFDADSTCSDNYLTELEKLWILKPNTSGCSIRYAHPIDGNNYNPKVYDAIAQYELHLRYYMYAGRYIHHPFSFQTVGSSMASSAQTYVNIGGMSKRKAGEDFYFLQKIIPHGNFEELNSAIIYPSPRPSNRVPFGTGRAISTHINQVQNEYLTYQFESFLTLTDFLGTAPTALFNASDKTVKTFFNALPSPLQEYLEMQDFYGAINEINTNTSTAEAFAKRFFLWFDAFHLLKYLNQLHTNYFQKQPIFTEAAKLASLMNPSSDGWSDTKQLLHFYRMYDLNPQNNFPGTF